MRRAEAARRAAHRLDAWDGAPVLAYGFDDISPVQASLFEALAGACRGRGRAALRAGRPRL